MPEQTAQCTRKAAIMIKGGWIGAFFLHINGTQNVIYNYDPRRQPPFHYWAYLTPADAESNFLDFVAQTRDNGWSVAWHGTPNNAQLS